MKRKMLVLSLISIATAGSLTAQIETDDMYFNSKDRAKLREARKSEAVAMASERGYYTDENPTDSYSARNVNPEYISRSGSQSSSGEEDYYVNNYSFQNRENINNWNNNVYSNAWYRPNDWASPYAWNNPYYGYGYYDAWSSPWYDPYWGHGGYSSSFSFHYGRSWNYGWGGAYQYWNRPYWGGPNAYWNYYGRPSVVIINNGEGGGRNISYGKRPSRGSTVVQQNRDGGRTRDNVGTNPNQGNSNGRVSNNRNNSRNYNWNNNNSNSNSSVGSRPRTESNRSWYNNSGNSNSNSSYSPARSSSPSMGTSSGGSRSSGSGSNGRSRGGN